MPNLIKTTLGLDQPVLQIKTKTLSIHTADSKPVKQEVNGTVILPYSVFPGYTDQRWVCWTFKSDLSSKTKCDQNYIYISISTSNLKLELSASFCSTNLPQWSVLVDIQTFISVFYLATFLYLTISRHLWFVNILSLYLPTQPVLNMKSPNIKYTIIYLSQVLSFYFIGIISNITRTVSINNRRACLVHF